MESFESRARIKLAKRGIGGFPTLSIQHLIDILRDQLDDAPNLNQKRLVMMEENAFRILKNIGVTTKEAYDAAPLGTGFVKNVEVRERLRYIITGSMRTNHTHIVCAHACMYSYMCALLD